QSPCPDPPTLGNWVRSACPIPPWFVVSFALPTTSTRANWLRSGAFRSPRAPWGVERVAWSVISLTHRFTGHCSRATRHHHPLAPAGNWARFNDGRFRVATEAKLRPLARFG